MSEYLIKNNLSHLLKYFKIDVLNIINYIDNKKDTFEIFKIPIQKKIFDLTGMFDNIIIKKYYSKINWKDKNNFEFYYSKIKKIVLDDIKNIN